MGGEEILREIATQAEAEADRIIAEGRQDAVQLVEAAREAARARIETTCQRGEPEARAEAVRLVNAARLRLLHRRAEMAAAASEAVFAGAARWLEELSGDSTDARWRAALTRYAEEALTLTGDGSIVGVRARDAASIASRVEAARSRLEPLDDETAPAGLVARSADRRVEIEATVPARLARARLALAEQIAEILGLGG